MNISPRGVLVAAAFVTAIANVASAQNVFSGTNAAEERNEDLREAIEEDEDRDLDRFGNEGRPDGFTGSLAMRSIASSGNTDSVDVGVGADLNFVRDVHGVQLQLNYTYGEDNSVKNEESLFYDFQYTRSFDANLYGFGKVQGAVDEFSSFDSDTFVSLGLGYRLFNRPDFEWSVQAGPGYRFADLNDIASTDVSESGFGVSSNLSRKLTETLYLTSDTDIVTSSFDTGAYSDIALRVSMTDALALRMSMLTEYHTDPVPGFTSTDRSFGVSLVYAFN